MAEILRGLGVSPGVAVGRVRLVCPDPRVALPARALAKTAEEEIHRLSLARQTARDELLDLADRVRAVLGEHYAAMFEAQLLVLDDPGLMSETERGIRQRGVVAEAALAEAVEEFTRRFESVDQDYFRERGGDLGDVHRRLQRLLRGERSIPRSVPGEPFVLVTHSLGPSEAVALVREGVVGLATDVGGPTSHTAILAHALGIPAVIGLHDVTRRVVPGVGVVLDGERGLVEVDPGPEALRNASVRREEWLARASAMALVSSEPAVTRDGQEVVLRANIEIPAQVDLAVRCGARGVGLYRSEFLFVTRFPRIPSEEEHYQAYREMAERVAPHPAVIRTLDLGGTAYVPASEALAESNPVLGLRAVRLCLRRPDIFVPQLRGLLRAAAHGEIRILVPLVTTREEIVEVRALLAREVRRLREEGHACRESMALGAMVETPAAAVIADQLARDCDFLSVGTNDLIQYALAVDRGNESVGHLYEPLHPAVLRMVEFVARSGRSRGIPVSLCGEMAADPRLVGLLLGLGLRELSVEPRVLASVAEAVRRVDAERAAILARRAMDCRSASEVARALRENAEGSGCTTPGQEI